MVKDYQTKLEGVKAEAETELLHNEMKEYQTRIAVLQSELQAKNGEIQQVNFERNQIEQTVERIMNQSLMPEEETMTDQTEKIKILNKKYNKALKDKVDVYEELASAVLQLS